MKKYNFICYYYQKTHKVLSQTVYFLHDITYFTFSVLQVRLIVLSS
jgi:hypothetical protein